jgi:MFS family permease
MPKLPRIIIDLTPVRAHPAFRRMWAGETVSAVGTQLTATAIPLQVYRITSSSFAVGLTGLVAVVPMVAAGLFGGAVSDAVDRRRLVLATGGGLTLVSTGLLVLALRGLGTVWPLYLLIAVQSALTAVDSPGRRAIIPNLVPLEIMPSAVGLEQIGFNVGMTMGPLLAGVAVAGGGFALAYGIDAVSFLATIYAALRLPPMPPLGGGTPAGLASVADGLRFLRGQPVVMMTFVVDLLAMIFGMPRALFPQLAHGQFGGGPLTAGFLYSAAAAGALAGATVGGWFGRVRRQGLAVLVAVAGWGLAITLFGLTHTLVVGLVLLAAAGAADMVSAVFRTAILNTATPDGLRGRLQGVFIVVVAGGPRLGDLEAGVTASLVSPAFSVISGGLACVVGVTALAAAVPSFRRYDHRVATAPDPERESSPALS